MKILLVTSLFVVVPALVCLAQDADKNVKEAPAEKQSKIYSGEPIKALLITGGCCHNYLFQSLALTTGSESMADIEWTVVNEGGKGTDAQIDLYKDPDWAKKYDVVVHNECFADTDDEAYVKSIVAAHKAGVPAVVVHCAMHTYRAAKFDAWREFLGVTSRRHDHQPSAEGRQTPIRLHLKSSKSSKDRLYNRSDWVVLADRVPDSTFAATAFTVAIPGF